MMDGRLRPAGPLLSFFLLATIGCDGLLDVNNPEIITPADIEGEAGINALHTGAVGDFAYAWSWYYGPVVVGGTLADEWIWSGREERGEDRREIHPDSYPVEYFFDYLQRARVSTESSAKTIAELSLDALADPRIAELHSLAGYAYVAFGENFCSGVPFSTAPETGALQFGEPKTTSEMFEIAIEQFDKALATTAGDETLTNLALVGKARTLLNLGQFDAAAAEVSSVPTAFKYVTEHSDNSIREANLVYFANVVVEWLSLADSEGGTGLPFRSANDPRVPWTRTQGGNDVGQDFITPQYDLLKYPNVSAPLVLADGVEARLIEGEAMLRAGDTTGWLDILNQLRADTAMAPLTDPGNDDARVDLHFSERAFWMFATGHRLGDMRRLVRQYGREPDSVFPTGTYHKGGVYGTDVNLPVPSSEKHNPSFDGCLNREP